MKCKKADENCGDEKDPGGGKQAGRDRVGRHGAGGAVGPVAQIGLRRPLHLVDFESYSGPEQIA
jgi:hypothetical protein